MLRYTREKYARDFPRRVVGRLRGRLRGRRVSLYFRVTRGNRASHTRGKAWIEQPQEDIPSDILVSFEG